MSQVRVTVGPKSYTIACGPGEEEKVARLASLIDEHYRKLGTARAPLEAQNMLFASIFMADELDEARSIASDARAQLAETEQQLQRAKDDAANALRQAQSRSENDREKSGSHRAELRAQIETLRKAEERTRKENARLKAEITELREQARHQHDLFGGPAEDAALSDALAEKLEAMAIRAEMVADQLEAGATKP